MKLLLFTKTKMEVIIEIISIVVLINSTIRWCLDDSEVPFKLLLVYVLSFFC